MTNKVNTYKNKAASSFQKGKKATVNAVKKGVDTIVENPITTVKVLGAAVGVYLLYKAVKGLGDAAGNATNTASEAVGEFLEGSDVDVRIDGTGGAVSNIEEATITDSQSINYASQLLDASNWSFFNTPGTDNKIIEAVFDNLKNSTDFLLVYHAFGEKDYTGFGSPSEGFANYFEIYKKQDLVYWLRSELNSVTDKDLYNKVAVLVNKAGFVF